MKFKEFFNNFIGDVKYGVSRFLVAFICSVLGFLTAAYQIISENDAFEIFTPLYMAFALTAVVSVILKITQEYITNKLNCVIQYIVCGVTAVISFLLLKANYESLYAIMAYSGIVIAALCFIFGIIMRGENRDSAFPKLVSSLVFSISICSVITGGLSACYAAFDSLIFNWENSYKVYLIIIFFVWIIGFLNIFLSFMPKKDVPVQQSKMFRIFTLFAGLPLYALLLAILLVYLAKIVITWNMPVGEINIFSSLASLFFIFFLMSVLQYPEKFAKLFVKFGGYFLIPVLIMQAIAVFERINAYGLTTPRTVSITLIVISVLFIAGSIIIPKHLNKIAFLSGIIVLIVTVTPLNVIDMPIASQTNILKDTLIANEMLVDNSIVPNKNISSEDAKKIISSYEYLKYDAKNVPDFVPNENKTVFEIFGIKGESYGVEYNYCNYRTKSLIDIKDFSQMLEVYNTDDFIEFEQDGNIRKIDLKQIAEDIYAEYGSEHYDMDIYMVDDNTGILFFDIGFSELDNEFCDFYAHGYVLIK